MNKILRRVFRSSLKYIVLLFLQKNNIEVITVMGWNGGDICKEALYTIFSKRGRTRKNVITPQTEFDLPLEIIGIKDIPHNRFFLVYKVTIQLFKILFTKRVTYRMIIELNTANVSIMKYWTKLLHPKVEVYLNTKSGMQFLVHLLLERIDNRGTIIANKDSRIVTTIILQSKAKKQYFGTNIQSDLVWEKQDNNCIIKYKDDEVNYKHMLPDYALSPLIAAIHVGLLYGYSLHNCVDALEHFQLPAEKIQTELYKFYE